MRLLKTGPYVPGDEKLEIIEKWGQDIPPYAILSHTVRKLLDLSTVEMFEIFADQVQQC